MVRETRTITVAPAFELFEHLLKYRSFKWPSRGMCYI